jgi:hypothetical protein
MTRKAAVETIEQLLEQALDALRSGHPAIAETKAEQAMRRLAAHRLWKQNELEKLRK